MFGLQKLHEIHEAKTQTTNKSDFEIPLVRRTKTLTLHRAQGGDHQAEALVAARGGENVLPAALRDGAHDPSRRVRATDLLLAACSGAAPIPNIVGDVYR